MNEKIFAQIVAELKHAQGEAMGLLTQAICQQLDPARLKTDLEGLISAARTVRSTSPISIEIAQHALAAAHAEAGLKSAASEGPHPTREG